MQIITKNNRRGGKVQNVQGKVEVAISQSTISSVLFPHWGPKPTARSLICLQSIFKYKSFLLTPNFKIIKKGIKLMRPTQEE